MAENYLITGYHGEPHITAENDRGFNAAVFGAGRYVLPVGEQFRAEYLGNNTVRIYDGKLIDNGAVGGIPAGKYVDLLIPEAGQGMNRNDLIIFQYSKDSSTLIESGTFQVLSGTETSGTATDPSLHKEDILTDEATLDQMGLYRVSVSGAVIFDPVALFSVARNVKSLSSVAYNLLDNSDFSNPVASGTSGTSSYILDRWTANKLTITQETNDIKTVPTATYAYIKQNVKVTPGKTYTCAARFSNAGVGEIRIYNTGITTQYAKVAKISMVGLCSFTVPDGVTEIAVLLYPNATNANSGIVYWAALYEGEYTKDTLPEYQPRGYSVESAVCGDIKLLWENASPSSSFPEQTLSTILNGYDMGIFIGNEATDQAFAVSTILPLPPNDGSGNYTQGYLFHVYNGRQSRKITITAAGTVKFGGGYYATGGSSNLVAGDSYMIPAAIYGVKGVK